VMDACRLGTEEGGGIATLFSEIWCLDFEFRADPGERPWPVCLVAHELKSGRTLRLWRDELLALPQAPFNVGSDALFVAYFASAELGCFLELGWPLPQNVLDLYVEHRVETNSRGYCDNSLLGALSWRGLPHVDAGEKETMRRLICDQRDWSHDEQNSIFQYCSSDVQGLAALFPRMATGIDLPRAILRGRYMKAVAAMERNGVPIDLAIHQHLVAGWDNLKGLAVLIFGQKPR
jgi:DNA polymerase-1